MPPMHYTLPPEGFGDPSDPDYGRNIEFRTVGCADCNSEFLKFGAARLISCMHCGVAFPHGGANRSKKMLSAKSKIYPFRGNKVQMTEALKKWLADAKFIDQDFRSTALQHFSQLEFLFYPYWIITVTSSINYKDEKETGNIADQGNRKSEISGKKKYPSISHTGKWTIPASANKNIHKWLYDAIPANLNSLGCIQITYGIDGIAEFPVGIGTSTLEAFEESRKQFDTDFFKQYVGGDAKSIISTEIIQKQEELVFLPVAIGGIKFKDKVYPIYISSTTGEVQGSYPQAAF